MEFITSNFKKVSAKSKLDALKQLMETMNYPDHKIYWMGNAPYAIPFVGCRTIIKAFSVNSKVGKAFMLGYAQYIVK